MHLADKHRRAMRNFNRVVDCRNARQRRRMKYWARLGTRYGRAIFFGTFKAPASDTSNLSLA